MSCTEEIVRKVLSLEKPTAEGIRVILNDYDITEKSRELTVAQADMRQKAVRMFIVTKKVEGCTERTIQYYMGVLRRFFNELDFKLEEIGQDQIRYYIAVRSTRDHLSKTSQDNELRVLKSFFKWCDCEDYIQKNPTVNVKSIKKEKRIKKAFTETELEMIRRSAQSTRDKAIIEVLYSTGVRVSELCGMDRADVKQDEVTVFGKGEKERIVYLNARARLAVQEYIETRSDGCEALFVTKKAPHGRLQKGSVEKIIREIGNRAGVCNCHPHRFRRTAATLALNRGMPIEQVQQMLGHEDIGTTTIYARSTTQNVRESHRKYVV